MLPSLANKQLKVRDTHRVMMICSLTDEHTLGASTFGQQASTYGQQASRSVNTFAESNNINAPVMGTLAEASAKAARILKAFVGKPSPLPMPRLTFGLR